jgi:hypothetical protein
LLPRVVAVVVLLGAAIYLIASALGVQRAEFVNYFIASVMLVMASFLTALVLFGIVRLFRRR